MFNRVKLAMAIALSRMIGRTPVSLHRMAETHNRTVDMLREAAASAPRPTPHRRTEKRRFGMRRTRTHGTTHFPRNGAQECARRVRQIERGQLTISNGVVVPGLEYLGHGFARYAREDGTGQVFNVRA